MSKSHPTNPSAPKLSANGTYNPADQLLVDAPTLARRFGVSVKCIRKWASDGFIPFVKISRRCCRYPVAACDEIILRRRVNAISES